MCLTEHWLRENEPLIIPNYTCISIFSRKYKKGGGVTILKNTQSPFKFSTLRHIQLENEYNDENCFECCISLKLSQNNSNNFNTILLICIYRAPNNKFSEFIKRFEGLLNETSKKNLNTIICGDLNINLLDNNNTDVMCFKQLLFSFKIKEINSSPTRITHTSASLLDVVLTNIEKNISCQSIYNGLSIHYAQLISLPELPLENKKSQYITKRTFSDASIKKFEFELSKIDWSTLDQIADMDTQFESFMRIFDELYNKCFPLKTRCIRISNKYKPKLVKNKLIKDLTKRKSIISTDC